MLPTTNKQAGFVSLFTVIFFMLLITVITVGFLRIMALEQRQSLDNDLTASALAAANSGVEDGKRALLAYYDPSTNSALKTDLTNAFAPGNTNCDSLTGLSSVQTQLGITGQAVGSSSLNQSYTCLNVQLNSPDYLGSSQASQSEIFPLRGVANYDQIKVSWHLLSNSIGSDGDGKPSSLVPLVPQSLLPQTGGVQNWSGQGYPAYLRVQLFGYPNGNFTRTDLNARSRTVFLVPVQSGGASVIDLGAADPAHTFGTAKGSPNTNVQCGTDFTQVGTYLCTATLALPAGATYLSSANNYYLRLTPIYGATHFRVQLYDSSTSSTINLKDVQPLIDVTGKAQDVYRRLQVRVRVNAITGLPEFAAESANTICKNMQVADGSAGSWLLNNCP